MWLSNLASYYYLLSYQRFTPSNTVDMSKERDWPANLGRYIESPISLSTYFCIYRDVGLGLNWCSVYKKIPHRVSEVGAFLRKVWSFEHRILQIYWGDRWSQLYEYRKTSPYDFNFQSYLFICLISFQGTLSLVKWLKLKSLETPPSNSILVGLCMGLLFLFIQCLLDSAVQSDSFKPSRRVRTAPGGSHTDIFAPEDVGDALSYAPPMPVIDAQVRPKVLLLNFW